MAKRGPVPVGFVARNGLRAVVRRMQGGTDGPVKATSAADRNAELVALGGRLGVAEARHRARRAFASAERKSELDTAHMMRTAGDVAAALGGMKGVLMKLAQMQSYLDDSLPPPGARRCRPCRRTPRRCPASWPPR